MDLRYIYMYKPEEYNCQMNEVVSSRCKRNERAKRAHSLYIYIIIYSLQYSFFSAFREYLNTSRSVCGMVHFK